MLCYMHNQIREVIQAAQRQVMLYAKANKKKSLRIYRLNILYAIR